MKEDQKAASNGKLDSKVLPGAVLLVATVSFALVLIRGGRFLPAAWFGVIPAVLLFLGMGALGATWWKKGSLPSPLGKVLAMVIVTLICGLCFACWSEAAGGTFGGGVLGEKLARPFLWFSAWIFGNNVLAIGLSILVLGFTGAFAWKLTTQDGENGSAPAPTPFQDGKREQQRQYGILTRAPILQPTPKTTSFKMPTDPLKREPEAARPLDPEDGGTVRRISTTEESASATAEAPAEERRSSMPSWLQDDEEQPSARRRRQEATIDEDDLPVHLRKRSSDDEAASVELPAYLKGFEAAEAEGDAPTDEESPRAEFVADEAGEADEQMEVTLPLGEILATPVEEAELSEEAPAVETIEEVAAVSPSIAEAVEEERPADPALSAMMEQLDETPEAEQAAEEAFAEVADAPPPLFAAWSEENAEETEEVAAEEEVAPSVEAVEVEEPQGKDEAQEPRAAGDEEAVEAQLVIPVEEAPAVSAEEAEVEDEEERVAAEVAEMEEPPSLVAAEEAEVEETGDLFAAEAQSEEVVTPSAPRAEAEEIVEAEPEAVETEKASGEWEDSWESAPGESVAAILSEDEEDAEAPKAEAELEVPDLFAGGMVEENAVQEEEYEDEESASPAAASASSDWAPWEEEAGAPTLFTVKTNVSNELYEQAVALVRGESRCSPPLLQREMSITRADANKIIERMEAEGIVGPRQASGQRDVLGEEAREAGAS